jgi:hypothetical protein
LYRADRFKAIEARQLKKDLPGFFLDPGGQGALAGFPHIHAGNFRPMLGQKKPRRECRGFVIFALMLGFGRVLTFSRRGR